MLFPRKKVTDPQATVTTDATLTLEGLTAQIATLTATNASLLANLTAANDQLEQYANLEKLSAKAEKIGYTGDIVALFAEHKSDYHATLEAMIDGDLDTKTEKKVEANTTAFLNAQNPSVGSGETDTGTPTTRAEAVAHIKAQNPKMSTREATVIARETYANLFKTVTA